MLPTNYGRDFYLLDDYEKITHYIEKIKLNLNLTT